MAKGRERKSLVRLRTVAGVMAGRSRWFWLPIALLAIIALEDHRQRFVAGRASFAAPVEAQVRNAARSARQPAALLSAAQITAGLRTRLQRMRDRQAARQERKRHVPPSRKNLTPKRGDR